jgi:hypothetical protein
MQLISDEYRKLNKELHHDVVSYGANGSRHVAKVMQLVSVMKTEDPHNQITLLDYGCGKSTLARNLPYDIQQYDPAIEKYSHLPMPADIVVCTDVLEHIEPDCLDHVLAHLRQLTKKAGYFTACTVPAMKTLSDGRNAHLIVMPAKWWIRKFYEHFEVINFQKMEHEVIVIVEPKKTTDVENEGIKG